jgi:integrase-like protein
MANWRKTRTPGIYVAHSTSCPAFVDPESRCRCAPSWRGRRWDSATARSIWQKATKDRGEVLVWLGAASKGAEHLAELAVLGPTFETLGDQWLDGVERGHIGRRRGRGKPYSDTTIDSMRRSWEYHLKPEFGPLIAEEITELEWQRWIDQLAGRDLSRSTIAKHISVASDTRMRVAPAEEAASLLAALAPEDALPYAIAFYAGLRRAEISRLEWPDVLDGNRIATRMLVGRAKSEAGTQRRPPITDTLRDILAAAWDRKGRPHTGKVVERSVMSGKIAERVTAAWDTAGLNRITLHECRHTYASLLMAAGYTIKELMEFMGHADLQMVNRYVKLLPQPGEDDAAQRLNDYLRRAGGV